MVDVIAALTDSPNPNNYWKVLKHRLRKEGSELVKNCNQLKMISLDGKYYKTDVAETEQLFRLIQSIPSPKAEPFKLRLAQVGSERFDEMDFDKRINGRNHFFRSHIFPHRTRFKPEPMGFCNKLPHQKNTNKRIKNTSGF